MLGIPPAGTPAICQVILKGTAAGQASSTCCPFVLSAPMDPSSVYNPPQPQCSQSIANSPFSLALEAVTTPFTLPSAPMGAIYSNFTFELDANGGCDASAVNACCNMAVDGVQITMSSSVVVVGTSVDGVARPSITSPLVGPGTSGVMQTVSVSGLGLASGINARPTTVVVTVRLPAGASTVPDACLRGAPTSPHVGLCSYSLVSAAAPDGSVSMCCPSGVTAAVAPTVPVTPAPGSCAPQLSVPLRTTTMMFSYLEGPLSDATSTRFMFMVHNNASACPERSYCQDICNWELFINPAFGGALTFESDMSNSNGVASTNGGSNASVVFQPPPPGGTVTYTVVVGKPDVTIEQLCNGQALGTQTGASCAAVLRSPVVFSTVLFGQSDVAIPTNPSPPSPATGFCASGLPLSSSCVRVFNATYNSPLSTTVLDFNVQNYGPSAAGGCIPDADVMRFQVTFVYL